MGKRMKLPFLSHAKSLDSNLSSSPSPPWPWPSCGGNLKTLSFRANKDETFRAFNSAFLDTKMTPTESFFTVSSSSRSFSTTTEDPGDQVESMIRGLRSDRLFFEPEKSSSLVSMENQKGCFCSSCCFDDDDDDDNGFDFDPKTMKEKQEENDERVVYKESEIFSMDSNNPYEDFRMSMEEMVKAHGLQDWQGLEELLVCYIKINGDNNHGYILGAFIDLLVSLSFAPSSSSSTSTTTRNFISSNNNNFNYSSPSSPLSLPSSSITTPCISSSLDHGDDDVDHHDVYDDDSYASS